METRFADWSDERLQREWDRDDKSDLAWTVALQTSCIGGALQIPSCRRSLARGVRASGSSQDRPA
jgi:hypothetical protein